MDKNKVKCPFCGHEQKIQYTYVSPFITSVAEGISSILGIFLDGWNTYISPVLDYLAEKFSLVWQEHIQPA